MPRQNPPAASTHPAAKAAIERSVPAPALGTSTEGESTPDSPPGQTSKSSRVLSEKALQSGDAQNDQPPRLQEVMPGRSNSQPGLSHTSAGASTGPGAAASSSPRQPLPTAAQALTPAEPPAAPPAPKPTGEMHLRLPNAGRESNVDVWAKEQTGELRVAVRTSNPELSQSLREKLPELVEQLGQKGFETQTWRPAGADARAQAQPRGVVPQEADLSGGTRDHGRSGQDQAGSGEHRQSDQEDRSSGWTEEWEKSFGLPADQTNRSGSRWHQS